MIDDRSPSRPGGKAATFHGCMDMLLLASLQKCGDEIRLHGRFASPDGHSAVGPPVKRNVLFNLMEKPIHRVTFSRHFQCLICALFRTHPTAVTNLSVNPNQIVLRPLHSFLRAYLYTGAAFPAFIRIVDDLHDLVLGMWRRAPDALQRTTLHENYSPDTRAIVNRKWFNIRY